MNDKWYEDQKDNLHEEKYHVITAAAANLIKNQVRCTNFDTDFYPLLEDIEIRAYFLPPSLKLWMDLLVGSKFRQVSLGQCIF